MRRSSYCSWQSDRACWTRGEVEREMEEVERGTGRGVEGRMER